MTIYEMVKEFKKKYSMTICWRLKSHSKVVEMHLNPGEVVNYTFAAQKSFSIFDIFSTFVVVLTNKRIILAQKKVFWGYTFLAITPDMFNDLTVETGLFWGKVNIDTVKERIILSNLDKSAIPEIETQVTEYMMNEKQKYIKIESEDR